LEQPTRNHQNSFVLALEQNTTLETFKFSAMRSDLEVMRFEPWWTSTSLRDGRERTAAQLLALYPSKIF
jgi:hypothetical protein